MGLGLGMQLHRDEADLDSTGTSRRRNVGESTAHSAYGPSQIFRFHTVFLMCPEEYIHRFLTGFFFYMIMLPASTAATSGLLYQPQMIGEGNYGAIAGIKIGKENRNTRRKPAPAPLCPPQIPLDQTRDRIRAATVGSQRLTA
jgi:hypothetical protein